MFKAKTVIALLFSVLMGLLAVKGLSMLKQQPAIQAAPVVEVAPAPETEKKVIEQPGEKTGTFSQAIPKGMRIVTIKVDEVSGVTRELKKDDRVDILAVTDYPGSQNGTVSRMVLQNIRIYDLGKTSFKKRLTDKVSKNKKTWSVHFLVTPDQGTVLASIGEAARLRLLLRNSDDTEIIGVRPIIYTTKNGLVTISDGRFNAVHRIKPGMRAISLEINNTDGICGTLEPGDRVDVIFSCKASVFSTKGGNGAVGTKGEVFDVRKSSKLLLQDVEVLATEQSRESALGNGKTSQYVTLVVTPKQAEKLAVITESSKSGSLKVITRNPGDRERVNSRGELFSDLVTKDKKAYRIVEILKGSAKYPVKFYGDTSPLP
jgi:Flp pilus assembly protein CpaB